MSFDTNCHSDAPSDSKLCLILMFNSAVVQGAPQTLLIICVATTVPCSALLFTVLRRCRAVQHVVLACRATRCAVEPPTPLDSLVHRLVFVALHVLRPLPHHLSGHFLCRFVSLAFNVELRCDLLAQLTQAR